MYFKAISAESVCRRLHKAHLPGWITRTVPLLRQKKKKIERLYWRLQKVIPIDAGQKVKKIGETFCEAIKQKLIFL